MLFRIKYFLIFIRDVVLAIEIVSGLQTTFAKKSVSNKKCFSNFGHIKV